MELDKNQKTPKKIIAASILLLLLVCLNMYCYKFYFLTEISWYMFIIYSLLLSIPCSIIIFYILKHQIKRSEVPDKDVWFQRIMSCFLGMLFYGIVLLFVPLGLNYYLASPPELEFTTLDYVLISHRDNSHEGSPRTSYCNIHFKHNGYSMRIRTAEDLLYFRLQYTVQKGWLGFNVITDSKKLTTYL